MKCPICQVELRITQSREEEDYVEQDLTCMNKECPNYKTVVEVERTKNPE